MVYCGKPSKGCAHCRAKRTKCDQKRPACSQCIRAHRVCPGYRDEQDLKFRDETSHVVNRQQLAQTPDKAGAYPSPFSDFSEDCDIWSSSNSQALISSDEAAAYNRTALRRIPLPMDFQGSGFFFYHYVSDDPASPVSYSHYLPAMYQSESAFNALPGIIAAIGIAGISNMQMDSTTMLWARQKHQQVLRCLNTALLEPKTAQADSTFMTVMLLGLFETVTCSSPQSLKSWATHVNGATAIAKARGQSQLQSTFGRQIFTHLRNQVLIDCIQRRKVVPQQILEWSEACVKLEPGKGSRRELELFPIIARLCHLRAVLEEDLKDDESLLTIAKSIDDGLINWADAFPDFLRYQTRSATPSESIYSDFYHVYPNTWVVGAWNMWRCSRILVHESMMRWLLRHPSYDRAQILKSETLLKHTNEDICASVPFVFGESHKDDPTPYVPRAAAGMTLLWPLYLAATMDTTPPSMRAWCLVQLERLGNAVGIHQATSLAQVLRSEKEITAWTRFDKQRPGEEVKEW